jgi:peptidoglycan lytic transglycosylase
MVFSRICIALSTLLVTNINLARADQIGTASWCEPQVVTASGEQMQRDDMVAAHPSLPFGTKVLVENLRNGRSVIVKITDRGPFAPGRIIDLNKVAAIKLGMLEVGLANVRVSVSPG